MRIDAENCIQALPIAQGLRLKHQTDLERKKNKLREAGLRAISCPTCGGDAFEEPPCVVESPDGQRRTISPIHCVAACNARQPKANHPPADVAGHQTDTRPCAGSVEHRSSPAPAKYLERNDAIDHRHAGLPGQALGEADSPSLALAGSGVADEEQTTGQRAIGESGLGVQLAHTLPETQQHLITGRPAMPAVTQPDLVAQPEPPPPDLCPECSADLCPECSGPLGPAPRWGFCSSQCCSAAWWRKDRERWAARQRKRELRQRQA